MTKRKSDNHQPIRQPLAEDNPLARLPALTKPLLLPILENYNIQEHMVNNLWLRSVTMDNIPGIIAIVTLTTSVQVALVNAPVLQRTIREHTFSYAEVIQLFSSLSDLAGDPVVGVDEQSITLRLCLSGHVSGQDEAAVLDYLQIGLEKIRADLYDAAQVFLGPAEVQPQKRPKPRIPRIKLYPKDMEVIYGVLSECHAHAQAIYLYMMESWNRRGGIITTTGVSICLDMPYGERQTRLAMLFPSYTKEPPAIGLFWEALKRFEGLPPDATQNYFEAVEKISPLRKTESTAYIKVSDEFTQSKARAVLEAMKTLAGSLKPEDIEPKPVSKPRTDPNLKATLQLCSSEWAQAYTNLIEGWREAGGTVHCPRVGRIYLRLKTHAHKHGLFSRQTHFFNLLVLAAPKGKHGCQIDIAHGLATDLYSAYMDCIPEEVNRFEQIISALPGFITEGVVTRINLGPEFTPKNGQQLLNAILALKTAEENAK